MPMLALLSARLDSYTVHPEAAPFDMGKDINTLQFCVEHRVMLKMNVSAIIAYVHLATKNIMPSLCTYSITATDGICKYARAIRLALNTVRMSLIIIATEQFICQILISTP